jgi:mRNA deadenylase 3'-5' endonuclease subunit Ccr4
MLLRVRVVSYNVLSSHLASPAQYPLLDPNHLLAANRLPAVLQKLEEALAATDAPTVFCLQEVSYDWAGAFHTWFANRGYHLVTGLYGKKFNGYM